MTDRLEMPALLPGVGVQTEEATAAILVQPFAEEEPSLGEARCREHLEQAALVVELPYLLAGAAVQAIHGSVGGQARAMNRPDVNVVACDERRGDDRAWLRRLERPDHLRRAFSLAGNGSESETGAGKYQGPEHDALGCRR